MSSNWPTTWDTFVRTILKAISSSPMISNLSNRGWVSSGNSRAGQEERLHFYDISDYQNVAKISLVLILVSEGFVDTFCDGLAMDDEAFCDRRLWIRERKLFICFKSTSFSRFAWSMTHHAGVIVGLLSWVDLVELGQVSRECLGAVYQHLLQTCQVLEHTTRNTILLTTSLKAKCVVDKMPWPTWRLSGSSWILVARVRISRSDRTPEWSVSISSNTSVTLSCCWALIRK